MPAFNGLNVKSNKNDSQVEWQKEVMIRFDYRQKRVWILNKSQKNLMWSSFQDLKEASLSEKTLTYLNKLFQGNFIGRNRLLHSVFLGLVH